MRIFIRSYPTPMDNWVRPLFTMWKVFERTIAPRYTAPVMHTRIEYDRNGNPILRAVYSHTTLCIQDRDVLCKYRTFFSVYTKLRDRLMVSIDTAIRAKANGFKPTHAKDYACKWEELMGRVFIGVKLNYMPLSSLKQFDALLEEALIDGPTKHYDTLIRLTGCNDVLYLGSKDMRMQSWYTYMYARRSRINIKRAADALKRSTKKETVS